MEFHTIRPFKKQREAYSLLEENRVVLYGGAIRGGKSYWGCLALFTFCLKYPKSRWLILRENGPVITRNLIPTINKILQNGMYQYVVKYNKLNISITFHNGSEVIIMAEGYDSDKELDKFKGLEINGAFIDEINEIQEVTYDKIIERTGSWFASPGCPSRILASCNPTQGWVKKRFYEPWEKNELPDGVKYVPSRIYDNPFVPKDYLESLKLLPKYQYEVFVEGNWNIQQRTGGEFYKCFNLDKHVGPCKYNPDLPIHISFDENVNPYMPAGLFQADDKHIYQIAEVAGRNPHNKIDWVCREIDRMLRGWKHQSGLYIYGDATSRKDDVKHEKGYDLFRLIMDYLSAHHPQLRLPSSNPNSSMRQNFINSVLENEYAGITVMIDPSCKESVLDFQNVMEKSDGNGKTTKDKSTTQDPKSKVSYQKWGHFSDIFDYFICEAYRDEYMEYQTAGGIIAPAYGKPQANNDAYKSLHKAEAPKRESKNRW